MFRDFFFVFMLFRLIIFEIGTEKIRLKTSLIFISSDKYNILIFVISKVSFNMNKIN